MMIIGYFASFLMGMILGLIGGGGSILTVPILVYLMGITPTLATSYSLLIVGFTAAFGSFYYYRQGLVEVRLAIIFSIPAVLAVYLTRAFLMPAIPEQIMDYPFALSKDDMILISFSIMMFVSSIMLLRNTKTNSPDSTSQQKISFWLITVEGMVVGTITGFLGAGGGFLIIPALVLFTGLPVRKAIGSSLLIIALKSLIGFVGDLQNHIDIQIELLSLTLICTFLGIWSARLIAHRLNGKILQSAFAYFTLVIACMTILKTIS